MNDAESVCVLVSTWPLRNTWNRASENLFSAWIEKLFDDPLDAEPSWPALHEVVRDPSRNFLFNHLGLNEDAKIYLRPDCADLPYTLRAYFAYKMGLPYGFSKCSRGGGGKAPTCPQWFSLQNAEEAKPPPPPPVAAPIPPAVSGYFGFSSAPAPRAAPAPKRTGPAPAFTELVQIVSDSVHSGSGRTAPAVVQAAKVRQQAAARAMAWIRRVLRMVAPLSGWQTARIVARHELRKGCEVALCRRRR